MDTSKSGTTMLRRAIALGALSIALSAQVVSAQSDPVGYNALLASFSAAGLPGPGTGVVVEQNEAPLNGSSPPAFVPDATASFLNRGVNINYENSGGTATSWHASNVAQFFYGNAGSGFFPAYGVSTVDLFNANIWTEAGSIAGNTLNIYTSSLPSSLPTNKPAVANFSWVGGFGTATYDNDALRRFDWLIDQSNLVAVVGVNNGSSTIPALMASGYNSIAVGLSNGQSSSGTVGSGEPGLDGQGRSKPDIVAPIFATSYATPMVAAEAATLVQVARYYPSLSAGTNAAVVKAILLAGTDKNPLPTWSHTPTQPLDTQYGAGQMNFNWGYQILSAGPQTAGTTSLAGSTGWSYSSLNPSNSAGNTQTYYFQVPSGQPFDLSALLTWQRTVTYHAGNPITFTPSLATIDLNLYYANGNFTLGSLVDSSSSSIDNVQYVFDRGLPAGEYALQVTRADAISGAWNYALAWQMQAVPYWIAANGSWNSAANWNNDLVAGGIGREAALFAPTPTGINVTLDAPQTVGLLTLGNTASTSTGYIISAGSGGSLTFSNSGSSSQLNVTSGSHVISAPVVLASNLIVAPASGAALGISGNISGTGALTDSGAGMLVLMGSNTYGGTTTISAGTLQLGPGGTLGPSPVADNSVLQVNRPDMFTLTNSVSGTGALTQLGTGTTTLIGTNGYSGGTSVNAGNLVFGTTSSIPGSGTVLITGSGALNVSGAYSNVTGWLNSGKINAASNGALALTATSNESINMAGYPQLALGAASPGTTYSGVLTPSTSTYLFGGGGGTLTVASNLTGANALVVNNLGPGAVALSGSNSYSGDTTVANGSLVILSPSSIPGGNLNVGSNLGAFGLSAAALVLSDTSSALGKDLSALPFSAGNLAGVDPSSVLPVLDSSSVNPALLASGGMTTVPEPSALLLMLAAGCCSLLYRVARRP